jgi:hypothetical protein
MNWKTGITNSNNLTLAQWLVRESIRAKEWENFYWIAIDGDNALDITTLYIHEYNEVCDWIDQLESNAEQLFSSLKNEQI